MSPHKLIDQLRSIAGCRHLLTKPGKTAYYRSGFRSGKGGAAAVVFPTSLLQQWQVLQLCVDAGCAIIQHPHVHQRLPDHRSRGQLQALIDQVDEDHEELKGIAEGPAAKIAES